MQPKAQPQRYFSVPDLVVILLVATSIYGVVAIGNQWRSEFHPITQIDLSIWSLPYYTLLSATRGIVAYFISLAFTLAIGYLAAKSKPAERIIIPCLDIFQSIPVLGFLPGLSLGLIAIFPHTNIGLELAAVIMIFIGQVWNMTFSFYSSLKSVPNDFKEASTVMDLNWYEKLTRLELPYSAVNLAWNSLLSMAGGWFFLITCEAFTLGEKEYRLPGIGAYMDVAIKSKNNVAIVSAIAAMIILIVLMDFAIWRPILAWVQKFRMESLNGGALDQPLMQIWIRESRIVRWVKVLYHRWTFRHLVSERILEARISQMLPLPPKRVQRVTQWISQNQNFWVLKIFGKTGWIALLLFIAFGGYKLSTILIQVTPSTWVMLLRDTFWTLLRVMVSLLLSTLWAVPVGIWIGTSPKRVRIAQPIIQVMASFPAPMLFPLALTFLFSLGINFDFASMFLMFLGVQWYVLFNVLAGALRIPQELKYALSLMEASTWDRWKMLYLPSVFPSLVTGWMTAAGGAWNASVVAEYLPYQGTVLKTGGLGAVLNVATAGEDFKLFAASLTLMVFMVILLNRTVWARVYRLAQTRYRMDF